MLSALVVGAVTLDRPRRQRRLLLDLAELATAGVPETRTVFRDLYLEKAVRYIALRTHTKRALLTLVASVALTAALLTTAFVLLRFGREDLQKVRPYAQSEVRLTANQQTALRRIDVLLKTLAKPATSTEQERILKAVKSETDLVTHAKAEVDNLSPRISSLLADARTKARIARWFDIAAGAAIVLVIVVYLAWRRVEERERSKVRKRLLILRSSASTGTKPASASRTSKAERLTAAFVVVVRALRRSR